MPERWQRERELMAVVESCSQQNHSHPNISAERGEREMERERKEGERWGERENFVIKCK